MPYISLEQQGFYEPYRQLSAGIAAFQEARRQRKLDALAEQEHGMRQALMQRQLETMAAEQFQREQDRETAKNFQPRVITKDGYDWLEEAPGKWSSKRREPTLQEQLAQLDGLSGKLEAPQIPGGNPMAPGQEGAPQPPSGGAGGQLPFLDGKRLSLDFRDGRLTPTFEKVPEVDDTAVAIEDVPVPGGDPIKAEVKRKGGRVIGINPVNVTRVNANKPLGDEALNKFNAATFALGQLPDLEAAVARAGDAGGPVAGWLRSKLNGVLGPSDEQANFDNLSARTLAPIAKGVLGETGVLSDQDIARIQPLLPLYTDTAERRQWKLNELKKVLGDQVQRTLNVMQAAGRNVTEIRPLIDGMMPDKTVPPSQDPNAPPPPAGSGSTPVGTIKEGRGGKKYRKAIAGPDTDRNSWEEVL